MTARNGMTSKMDCLRFSGSIDDGLIQATLKGTPSALVSVIVAHMIENQYVEALIMQAATAFITYTEREEEKKQKEAQS